MNRAAIIATLVGAGLIAAGAGFLLGREFGRDDHQATPTAGASGERKVLYWHDPMVPGPRFDRPGKSPFMDMALVPVYADDAGTADGAPEGAGSGVKISPLVQQNLGVRTVPVRRADVGASFEAVGSVQFDERLSVAVQSRVAGYVEHLAVRAPMERVRPGQALLTIFAPDWLAPQNEYLSLRRAGAGPELIAAARDRLRAMSIPDALVRQSEDAGMAQARYVLRSPAGGVVLDLGIREGAQVTPGMTLFRIAGLHTVWAVAEIPEAQAATLIRGQQVRALLQADPSRTFDGRLAEILPLVSPNTRTLQARFEVDNRAGALTPGMLLRLQLSGASRSRLLAPAEAVIRTGARAIAIVRAEGGRFAARTLTLGTEFGDDIEVLAGLREDEEVVASGQFLIDSEARLKSVLGALAEPSTPSTPSDRAAPAASATSAATAAPVSGTASRPGPAPVAGLYSGDGQVEDVAADSLTLSHGPIPALGWPAMTMGFSKPRPDAFPDVKPGDTVRFEFRKQGDDYQLVSVRRTGGVR